MPEKSDGAVSHRLPLLTTILLVGFATMYFVAHIDPTSIRSVGTQLGKALVYMAAMAVVFMTTVSVRERLGV